MKRSYGFTLIELIVVISVIAILAGMVTPLVSSITEQARQARMTSDINTLKSAIVNYNARRALFPGPAAVANATQGVTAVAIITGTTPTTNPPPAGYMLNVNHATDIGANDNSGIRGVSNRLQQFLAKPITWDPWSTPYRYYIDTRTATAQTSRVGYVASMGMNKAVSTGLTAANVYAGNMTNMGDDYFDCFYKG